MTSRINYHGYFDGNFGIAEATRLNVLALEKSGLFINKINYSIEQNHQRLTENVPDCDINIFHVNINVITLFFASNKDLNLVGKYNIVYWAWEFPEVDREKIEALNAFNELWVPSDFCVNIFTKYTQNPVIKIPHAIEIQNHSKEFSREEYHIPKNSKIYLTIFDSLSSTARKNPQATIESFLNTHSEDLGTCLVVKTFNAEKSPNTQQLINTFKNYSNVVFISEHFSKQKLFSLIQQCDVLISLHGSEGFGLTMAEAMAYGKIVIGTGYSGNLEFMNVNNSFLVKYDLITIPDFVYGSDETLTLAKPNTKDASEKLSYIKNNFDDLKKIQQNANIEITQNFSLENIGNLMKRRLEFVMTMKSEYKASSQKAQNIFYINEIKVLKARINYLEKTIYNKIRKQINSFFKTLRNKK
ncbi:glycosyltransferase [Epilithonimonas hispanica]|uniref:Glycosyl transferase family 1 domain-containing protein n=1 Tax=Epilithonimonas hispanica TaxID=358687 RepID=A0A3D9D2B1_9FLAO|nr:glycosyltransferase [Epilithonimonas hispanica]REC72068.1 hypothetical protein DRF58_03715 [Epilithonimonas hispanica]